MLQGGGALGAYHIGAYQALAEHDLHPDWVAGISIGAINAAVIAGNPPDERVDRLAALWEAISWPDLPAPLALTALQTLHSMAQHRRGGAVRAAELLHPAAGEPVSAPTRAAAGGELLRHLSDARTLRRFADFALINRRAVRLSLGATKSPPATCEFFDNHRQTHRAGACAGQRLAAAGVSGDAGGRQAVLGRRLRLQLAAGCGGGRAGPAASGRVPDRPVGCRRAAAGNDERRAVARQADPVCQPHGASRR